jgi:hypothetical protein
MSRKVAFAALALMALVYVCTSMGALQVHEQVHRQIFLYFGIDSEIIIDYNVLYGKAIPNGMGEFVDMAAWRSCYEMHALNDIVYVFAQIGCWFVAFIVFVGTYYVLADLEKR